ncbi:MAG: hypothetical protein ACLQDV_30650 [Candidatus Binataceae bacterium]
MAAEGCENTVDRRDEANLFPQFERFVAETPALAAEKGSLAAKLPRILGQGKTRATDLDLPPAQIERMAEYVSLVLPAHFKLPEAVCAEMASVKRALEAKYEELGAPEAIRRLSVESLRALEGVRTGLQDNYYFAGRLVLRSSRNGREWRWCLTPEYEIISKIPADLLYITKAFSAAEAMLQRLILKAEEFEAKLKLSWQMARHFSASDDVLLMDVARMFKIAQQGEKFWRAPQRQFFVDAPDASFMANLLNWRSKGGPGSSDFEFVPATLNQAHGPQSKAFYIPVNPEGTQVRPIIYMRLKPKSAQ